MMAARQTFKWRLRVLYETTSNLHCCLYGKGNQISYFFYQGAWYSYEAMKIKVAMASSNSC